MKVIFICSEYPPFSLIGGIGIVTQCLAEALVNEGCEIFVVGLYKDIKENVLIEQINGVNIHRLKDTSKNAVSLRSNFKLYKYVNALVKKHKIDIVEAPDYLGSIAFWPKIKSRLVVRLHGSATYFDKEGNKVPSRKIFYFEKFSLEKSDAIIGVSNYVVEKSKKIFNIPDSKLITTIYNPVSITQLDAGKRNVKNIVAFSGTLMRKKGIFSLIKAWPMILSMFPDFELHCYGKNSFENGVSILESLEKMIDPSIRHSIVFHGHIEHAQLILNLRQAKVAVFPSYAETFGMGALEAMSVGCPTIFTKTTSGKELINHPDDGLLIDPDNPKDIANAVIMILSNDALAEKISINGQQKAYTKFNKNLIVENNLRFYKNLIEKQ